jgi:hypothetical protein
MQITINLNDNEDCSFKVINAVCEIEFLPDIKISKAISVDFIRESKNVEYFIECEINKIIHDIIKELMTKHDIKPSNFFSKYNYEDEENE